MVVLLFVGGWLLCCKSVNGCRKKKNEKLKKTMNLYVFGSAVRRKKREERQMTDKDKISKKSNFSFLMD